MTIWCRISTTGLALALVFAGAWPGVFASAARQIDIRDVQAVGTALLAKGKAPSMADLNHDGRVDILDFQCAVNQATGITNDKSPAAPQKQPSQSPTPAPSTELLALKVPTCGPAPLPAPLLLPASAYVAAHTLTPSEELHRLGLVAHAPPCA